MANDSINSSQPLIIKDDSVSFVQDEIQLKRLLRDLDRASKEAVIVLLKCLKSRDEKMRYQASVKLLEFKIDVTEKINSDKLQRMVAEVKLGKPSGNGSLVPQESRPVVDFSKIREIE